MRDTWGPPAKGGWPEFDADGKRVDDAWICPQCAGGLCEPDECREYG